VAKSKSSVINKEAKKTVDHETDEEAARRIKIWKESDEFKTMAVIWAVQDKEREEAQLRRRMKNAKDFSEETKNIYKGKSVRTRKRKKRRDAGVPRKAGKMAKES